MSRSAPRRPRKSQPALGQMAFAFEFEGPPTSSSDADMRNEQLVVCCESVSPPAGGAAVPGGPAFQAQASEKVSELNANGAEVMYPPAHLQAAWDRLSGGSKREADLRSAIKTVGRVLNQPLSEIPTQLATLRGLLATASPLLAGVSLSRWTQVRSRLVGVMEACGIEILPGRSASGPSAEWQRLLKLLPDRGLQVGLSRLASYCSAKGFEPPDVTEVVTANFEIAVMEQSLLPEPNRVVRSAIRSWIKAVECLPCELQFTMGLKPDERRYALKADNFLPCFIEDLERYLGLGAVSDPFSDRYAKALSPDTIVARRRMFLQIATALVNSGTPIEAITSLADLTRPENAKAALKWLRDRNGAKSSPQITNQAHLLVATAKNWVDDPAHVKPLQLMASAFREESKYKGMAPKNRDRLRQFSVEGNLAAILLLPSRVLKSVESPDVEASAKTARRVMMALAIEILTMAPIRIKNLAGLELGEHLKRVARGPQETWHIVLSEQDTKTKSPYAVELPPTTVALLRTYLGRFRPVLTKQNSQFLFPGRSDKIRNRSGFGAAITKFISRETGLEMHPHLFRHFAAKLHLDLHPQQIETVRMVLGHSSTRTTLKAYAELGTNRAVRNWDNTVETLRIELAELTVKAPSNSKKNS